jgi:hypothetical protein
VTETNVFQLSQPGTCADPLTEVLRNGARALLTQAVEACVDAWSPPRAAEQMHDNIAARGAVSDPSTGRIHIPVMEPKTGGGADGGII